MNPWETINLDDYENHMKSDSVMQLQALDSLMAQQFSLYPVRTMMILGIAGGNGLSHISCDTVDQVIGVDINSKYLEECEHRYPELSGKLQLICQDLLQQSEPLPHAELIVADLLIEYIGYECFQKVIRQVEPVYVTCGIQINTEQSFVSDSPYLHVFDGLDHVHHQMAVKDLIDSMREIGYLAVTKEEINLPNGKKLVRLDFEEMKVLLEKY